MHKDLQKLLDIQKLDLAIKEYADKKAKIEHHINQIEAKFLAKSKLFEARYNEFKKKEVELMQLNLELKSKEEQYKKCQSQLMQATTPKQVKALDTELMSTKKIINELEDKVLVLMEEVEKQKKEIENEKKDIEQEKIKVNETKQQEQKIFLDILEKEQEHLKRRETMINDIDKNLLDSYERIRESRDGTGIVVVQNNACGGCFLELPPQIMVKLMSQEEIVFCPACSRILYYSSQQE